MFKTLDFIKNSVHFLEAVASPLSFVFYDLVNIRWSRSVSHSLIIGRDLLEDNIATQQNRSSRLNLVTIVVIDVEIKLRIRNIVAF